MHKWRDAVFALGTDASIGLPTSTYVDPREISLELLSSKILPSSGHGVIARAGIVNAPGFELCLDFPRDSVARAQRAPGQGPRQTLQGITPQAAFLSLPRPLLRVMTHSS